MDDQSPQHIDERAEWDEVYATSDRIWSGRPNGALVTEVSGLPPGRALDIGCGEGADAIWLADRGWSVTALDVSALAVQRARAHAGEAGLTLEYVELGLLDADLAPGSFDLVSAQYPALRHTAQRDTEAVLLDLLAPGGVLLFVHHVWDAEHGHGSAPGGEGHSEHREHDGHESSHRFDPADYVSVADIRARLGSENENDADRWRVEVDEERDREISGGGGAHHVRDEVLRARRGPLPIAKQ